MVGVINQQLPGCLQHVQCGGSSCQPGRKVAVPQKGEAPAFEATLQAGACVLAPELNTSLYASVQPGSLARKQSPWTQRRHKYVHGDTVGACFIVTATVLQVTHMRLQVALQVATISATQCTRA